MKIRPSAILWAAFHLAVVGSCLYVAVVAFMAGGRLAVVIAAVLFAFFMPVTLTVVWILICEFFRFTLPAGIARVFHAGGRRPANLNEPQGEQRSLGGGSRSEILEEFRPLRRHRDGG
jgi:hypothetical protein